MLYSKIKIPHYSHRLVRRPRLDKGIQQAFAAQNVIAICAGAGAGKTAQTHLFAERYHCRVAWLTLDADDRSGQRLLSYLSQALVHIAPGAQLTFDQCLSDGLCVNEIAAEIAGQLPAGSCLVVLDGLEALGEEAEPASVIKTFLENVPAQTSIALLSRSELSADLAKLVVSGGIGLLPAEQLNVTYPEAREIVDEGWREADVEALLEWYAGWIGGVSFAGHLSRTTTCFARETPPFLVGMCAEMSTYLRSEMLEKLSADEQSFLLSTALLESVSLQDADFMLGRNATKIWRRLLRKRLPISVSSTGNLCYYPYFKRFLQDQVDVEDDSLLIKQRYAALLRSQGRYGQATDTFLEIGQFDAAADCIRYALTSMHAPEDWKKIIDWVGHLTEQRQTRPYLESGLLRALVGLRHTESVIELVCGLHADGRLAEVASWGPDGFMLALASSFQCRCVEGRSLVDEYGGTEYRAEAVRYLFDVLSGTTRCRPPLSTPWADLDPFVNWSLFLQGRLSRLVNGSPTATERTRDTKDVSPFPLLGLVWQGELAEVRHLMASAGTDMRAEGDDDGWRHLEAWLLLFEGRAVEAFRASDAAVYDSVRRTAHDSVRRNNTSFYGLEPCFGIVAAAAKIRLGHHAEAEGLLEAILRRVTENRQRAYTEWAETFLGLVHIRTGRAADAVGMLSHTVECMKRAGRFLMLPIAAVYLAEAYRQAGDEKKTSAAAEEAYKASIRIGTFSPLQFALVDTPKLFQRQIQDDRSRSRWLRVSPVFARRACGIKDFGGKHNRVLYLRTFGPGSNLVLNGETVRLRLNSVTQLAAYLGLHDKGVDRLRLQRDLFPMSDEKNASTYLRQVIHQFWKVTDVRIERCEDGRVKWPPGVSIDTADLQFERLAASANAKCGAERLDRLMLALELVKDGNYLDGVSNGWVEERRMELGIQIEEARLEAARLSLEAGRLDDAGSLAEQVLESNLYAEEAYRILVRISLAHGRPSEALNIFRRLKDVLNELGVDLSGPTVQLMREVQRVQVG